jgi:hypothetical protein
VVLPEGLPIKPSKLLSCPPIRVTWPTHPILVDLNNWIIFGKEYKAYSSLRTLLHSHYFVSPFSKNLSLRSALNFSNQVSHPHKTTCKITVLNILKFTLSVSKLEDNHVFISGRWQSLSRKLILPLCLLSQENNNFGLKLLKSARILFTLETFLSRLVRIPITYVNWDFGAYLKCV